MAKRLDWTFTRTTADFARGAKARWEYHLRRKAWWEEERGKARQLIREAGVEVRAHPVTGGERHEVVLDPDLARRLAECDRKIAEHGEEKAEEFRRWFRLLDVEQGTVPFDFTDWQFFFGDDEED